MESVITRDQLQIEQVDTSLLRAAEYNPRKHDEESKKQLRVSIETFGLIDPIICNRAPERENIVIGGHFRLEVARELGYANVPVVYVSIPEIEREKELNLRLNRNTGEFDWNLLANFDESFLANIGFSTEELDEIFPTEENPEKFDLGVELAKLNIQQVSVQKGDVYEINGSKIMCGDSTIEEDVVKLMSGEKAAMCFTDPPYILDYLNGKKKNGKPTEGFGLRRDRKYLETDVLPPDFTEKWMANIAKVQMSDFSIIVFENPKNLRTIWNELEKHWKYRNTIVWHVTNRVQGFSAKYKFFNKGDIAVVGTSPEFEIPNLEPEDDALFQGEYEAALYATAGKPHWESYEKGKKICPTDFVESTAEDAKHSGQGVVFGTKPLEVLIPYIKVLTKRGDLIVEPFGGSGSTGVAAMKLGRRCYTMEKVPAYVEVIKARWEKQLGVKANKIS